MAAQRRRGEAAPRANRVSPASSRAQFDARVHNLGVRQLRIASRSPWQNGFAERWVGTLRRELLDHVIVVGERHLLRLVRQHVAYYNEDRPHMSLDRDAPVARAVQPPSAGRVGALPRVGGLPHPYLRPASLPTPYFPTTA